MTPNAVGTMSAPVGSVGWAEAVLGPELTAHAHALTGREPCRPGPGQIDRLRRIFTHDQHDQHDPQQHGHVA